MKKIIFTAQRIDELSVRDIDTEKPIFMKNKEGKLQGMLVEERDQGWIIRTGGRYGAAGYSSTAEECMQRGLEYGYTFHVEE